MLKADIEIKKVYSTTLISLETHLGHCYLLKSEDMVPTCRTEVHSDCRWTCADVSVQLLNLLQTFGNSHKQGA